jgi:hypothetical protein
MPAPNIATLYDFESAYEDALRNYFLNVNVGVLFNQILTPRTNLTVEAFVETPRLQIRAGVVGLGATGAGTQETQVTISNTATTYYSHYMLSVAIDVVTQRSNTSQPHGLFRGAVRQGLLPISAILNNTTVPYYQTAFVSPGPSTQSVDIENDEIQTQITYDIQMFIPPASFP